MINNIKTDIYDNSAAFAEDELLGTKPSTGVCFSGGGSRAHVLAIGQLRGLEELGLIKNIKYISSVSGGTWASTQYVYRESNNMQELLGKYQDAKNITLSNLQQSAPKLAQPSISRTLFGVKTISPFIYNYIMNLHKIKDKEIDKSQLWQFAVGDTFLKPFGLLEDFKTDIFNFNEETKNKFETLNPSLKTNKTMLQNPLSPYLIVNGTITQPVDHSSICRSSKNFIGIQFTPLYTEIPYKANDGKTPNYSGNSITPIYIGNGAIESSAYSSKPSSIDNNNQINVEKPESLLGLSAIAGISSNFLGGAVSNVNAIIEEIENIFELISDSRYAKEIETIKNDVIDAVVDSVEWVEGELDITKLINYVVNSKDAKKLLNHVELTESAIDSNPKMSCWSPLSSPNKVPVSQEFSFADGGCMDNYGIMPLLRRKVKKIVVFINTFSPLKLDEITDYTDIAEDYLDFNLPSLFGCVVLKTFNDKLGTDISHNQVFNASDFKNVLTSLQTKKRANEAVQVTTTHQVLENEWWGIDGGYDVEICWVYNEEVPNWEKTLSPDIQKDFEIGDSRDSSTKFPMYNTVLCTAQGFSIKEANLLAHLGAWNVAGTENKDNFINIFSK